jgi:FAD/FMN-containing dehydrogenase/Fe-S oxidoreductase
MYRQVPIGVVLPRDAEDVVRTVAACYERGVPVLGRGCGTSLAGQTCNVAVVIDFSKYMHHLLELDPAGRTAWVEPGVICDQLRDAAEPHDLTLAPDPATHRYCTLGGMIGNNSCGSHSLMGGKTSDNVEELEVLTYDGERLRVGPTDEAEIERLVQEGGRRGEIYGKLRDLRDRYADAIRQRFPDIPRRVSGYNLPALLPEAGFHVARALVGSESTCVLVLRAKVRLMPSPAHRALLVIGFPDLCVAADHVPQLLQSRPMALEAFQTHVIQNMLKKGKVLAGAHLLPPGEGWLIVEFGGDSAREATARARAVMAAVEKTGAGPTGLKVFDDAGEQAAIWQIREAGVGASRVPDIEEAWPSWEDAAVAPDKLGRYLRDFLALVHRHGYAYTMFGHFGQGCVHVRITFQTKTAAGVREYRDFMNEAADLVVSYGGSLSGEHGDGQARGPLLPKMFGPDVMQAFREFKRIWDPTWKMNPGKLIDAYPLDTDLRMGPDYRPRPVLTHFQFPDDHGSFAAATERCFGVGKCRGLDGGTMCPSFMVTREEQHTTRGRAHLLFEMLRGDAIRDGWRDESVKDALDLCLACKGCKGDCPVSVDVATYKAEFLSHYYAGRLRPRSAYAFGLIMYWARLAALAPGVVNFATQTPGLRGLAKRVAGVAPARQIPAFAPETLRAWFRRRPPRNVEKPPVILWPDTFNNHFHPETAKAAVEVLEAAGYQVRVPPEPLCCGRPLYDYGMLDLAARFLRQILAALREDIAAGVPVVGLEPSCVAVFRDELRGLLPNDEDARRLGQQTYLLSEFLAKEAPDFAPPRLARKALVQLHCHHKSVLKHDAEEALLQKLGLDYEVLNAGCCGMAGGFGFEAGDKYDVSIKAGERVLLPAVRNALKDTLIISDGFSCREQIAQTTDRRALHVAEVLQMALHGDARASVCAYPEPADGHDAARAERRTHALAPHSAAALAERGHRALASPRSRTRPCAARPRGAPHDTLSPAPLPPGTRSAPWLEGRGQAGAASRQRETRSMRNQHEAVAGVFRDRAEAGNAIEALKDAAFAVDDISILMPDEERARAGEDETNTDFGSAGPAVAGGVLGGAAGWLVGLGSFVVPGVGPFIGAGALITSLAGAAIGASIGALASGLVQMGVPEEEARWYEQEVRGGRTLVTVRAGPRYAEARDLLRHHGAYDVEQREPSTIGESYHGIPHRGT